MSNNIRIRNIAIEFPSKVKVKAKLEIIFGFQKSNTLLLIV
jgi:hypothetical protein